MRLVRYYIIAMIVILLDQWSKWLIVHKMSLDQSISVIGQFFEIVSVRNRGAAFSILQNQRLFFIIIHIVVAIAVVWYLSKLTKTNKKLLPFALSLLLGGALGNFIDRAFVGRVVDFLQFHFQFSFFGHAVNYIFPVFNVADSAIVVGVILIFLDSLFTKEEKKGQLSE